MKEIVIIKRVDQFGVTYTDGRGASRDNFPDVKVGQKWEIETSTKSPHFQGVIFPLGVIVSTKLIEEKIK